MVLHRFNRIQVAHFTFVFYTALVRQTNEQVTVHKKENDEHEKVYLPWPVHGPYLRPAGRLRLLQQWEQRLRSSGQRPAQQETAELSGTITANGSTSMEKVIQILEEQFMIDNPGVKASYDPTGSGTGIEAAKNGTADIGLASRALKDEEIAAGLKGTNVALDGIAVIVNAGSKVEDLTVEQIAQVFTGEDCRLV